MRESKGLLLRQVGAELSIDPTILSKIERNGRLPTKQQVRALAKFFQEQKSKIIIACLGDKIVYDVKNGELGLEAMKVAEQKIEYLRTQKG